MFPQPSGSGECCLPGAEGVTYLKVGETGVPVGMVGLDKVFQQLILLGRQPEDATDAELVGMARKFNYIPSRAEIETNYAAALRQAYAGFYARQEQKK
jgi:hypothetical protein